MSPVSLYELVCYPHQILGNSVRQLKTGSNWVMVQQDDGFYYVLINKRVRGWTVDTSFPERLIKNTDSNRNSDDLR